MFILSYPKHVISENWVSQIRKGNPNQCWYFQDDNALSYFIVVIFFLCRANIFSIFDWAVQ